MSKNIAVLDIGTTGVRLLASRVNDGGLPHIIAKAAVPCRAIKKFSLYDRDVLVRAIGLALDRVEEQSGVRVRSVYASIPNHTLSIVKNSNSIDIADEARDVTFHDMALLLDKVADIEINNDDALIDILPLKYYIDGETAVDDPLGVPAKTLKADGSVIVAKAGFTQEIKSCIEEAGLFVDGFVPQALSMSDMMPEYTEEMKSILLIDIGGSVTDYALYYKGKMFTVGAVPAGGDNITSDLATVFKISQNEAEALKRDYPIASDTLVTNNIDVAVHSITTGEQEVIKVVEPVKVMQARIEEIFGLVARKLHDDGIEVSNIDKVVVSGDGISAFKGIDLVCTKVLGTTLLEIDYSRLTGLKTVYTLAGGMVMYIASQLPLGRKQCEFEKEFQNEELMDNNTVGGNGVKNKIVGKFKNMLTGFRE